jgi:serine protease Do
LKEAKAGNRPLFVTMRCLPCKQCSAFDKDVLEGGPDLDPLLRQFITVRLTSAKDIDLRLLPVQEYQDLDLSWWGYFLSPEGRIYGIFGGRDEVSDETRISKAALVNTLRRVLAWHDDPRRPTWNADGPAPDLSGPAPTPTQLPGFASWNKKNKWDKQTEAAGCMHCHQVAEVLREPAIEARQFDKSRDLDMWPLPENVGIKLDRDDGLRVTEVMPGSPADRAGIQARDELAAADGRKLFGQTDFRGVLHRGPRGEGTIEVFWLRGGQVHSGILHVSPGWRATVLGWRMSVSQGNIGAEPGFWPLTASAGDHERLHIPAGKLLVRAYAPFGNAKAAGLDDSMWVTEIDGQTPDLSGRYLLVWFRLHYEMGDPVTLTVLDASGKSRDLHSKAGH